MWKLLDNTSIALQAALGNKVPESRGWTPLGDGLRDQLKSDIRIDEDQAKLYSDALNSY